MTVLAWMDDWQMSAQLAKLSTSYSYSLIFCESHLKVPDTNTQILAIIDLQNLQKADFEKLQELRNSKNIFIIGYTQIVDGGQVKQFKSFGCDMVLRRNKLLKNLETIMVKIENAS